MEFRILGPLELEDNGRPVEVSGRRLRALLALLLLHGHGFLWASLGSDPSASRRRAADPTPPLAGFGARRSRNTAWVSTAVDQSQPPSRARAFRGLALVFFLAFVNLLGVAVTAAALGGIAPWTPWQFIGLFGVIETASGLANVITPNIWRLPVAELETSARTDVKLAGSTMLLPHWGGLARSAAGVVCLGLAAWQEGLAPASIGLVPLLLALAWIVVTLSAALARAGVARPDLDVVQFVVRWGKREQETPPLSVGASVLQFLLSIATIPAVKSLPPSVLYQPELAPSPAALAWTTATSAVLLVLVYALWAGRVEWSAPAEQQREAEEQA